MFEIRGGKVDKTDTSIHDAIVREVAEETSLTVLKVVNELLPFWYTTEKLVGQEKICKVALQHSYLVEVQQQDDFVVDPYEHCEGAWVTVAELPAIPMTDGMRKLVFEAFDTTREY
ncbi:MutT family protein [Fusarium austroafricanum]|uniref:MutT family protein n=1 Tax=Fusarium austroafricanum TaxID=2364996 RepID=A0A8H4NZM5_9HYPO|nr:MutT family protein [Fusarium austroafricanum]